MEYAVSHTREKGEPWVGHVSDRKPSLFGSCAKYGCVIVQREDADSEWKVLDDK